MTEPQPITPKPDDELPPFRCSKCGRIIFRAVLASGTVLQVKCKCNQVNIIAA